MTVRGSSDVLVGREAELATLCDAFKRVRNDEAATVLLGGEAGVGKTRLLEEFARLTESDGGQVLLGQCLQLGEEGLPFAPFAGALREVLRRDGPARFSGYESEFARLLPELGRGSASSAGGAGGVDLPAAPDLLSDTSRGHLFELLADLFGRIAGQRPLVLVLEDLHWADRSTRDVIAFLVRAARNARTLIVCSYRSDELHRGHPLRAYLGELERARGVQRIDLDRLDRDGTAQILTQLLGGEPDARTVDAIHERAQGNPFFIEELAAAGCADLPDSVRDLLLARVDRLPEVAQRVLRIASAGGNRIGHDLLSEVASMPDAELEQALRAAVAAQLIVANAEGGYEFRHALVREAVHEDLLPGEHARLHARYGAAIEAKPHLVGNEAPAAVAHHWYAAHDHPRALVTARTAADAARSRYAYAEQSRLLDRVLRLWEQVPDAGALLGMDHLALLEEALAAAATAGESTRALSLTRAALAEVDRDVQPLRAAELHLRHSRMFRILGKSDGADEMRKAYRLAAGVPEGLEQVRLLARLASDLVAVDLAEGTRIAQEAAAAAEKLGDPTAIISATLAAGRIYGFSLEPEAGLQELRRAHQLAIAANHPRAWVWALVNISDLLYRIGHYEDSASAAAEGMAEAKRVGISRSTGAFLLSNRAEALVALGRWDEADELCAKAARLDLPGTLGLHWLLVRAAIRLNRGHPGAADVVNRAVAFLGRPYVELEMALPLHELRIRAALAAADPVAAAAAGRAALAMDLHSQPRYGWRVLAAAGRAAVSAADPDLRSAVASAAASLTATYPAEFAHRADLHAILAEGADRVAAWGVAVGAWRTDGQPYPLANALLCLAAAAAAAGDRPGAAAALEESRAIAAQLDAVPLRDQVATLARRIGLRGSDVGLPSGDEALTPREREVLRLVAEGLSNSRIAQRLYISPKTASVHVSRILAKLAVSNRVEAAALAHRLGLVEVPDDGRRDSG